MKEQIFCNKIIKELNIKEITKLLYGTKKLINNSCNINTLKELEYILENIYIDINELKNILEKELNMSKINPKKMICFRLDIEDYIELENILKSKNMTMTNFLKHLIKNYIKENKI